MGLSIEELFNVKGTILLEGETGSGKSYGARLIHLGSPRKNFPFLTLNLATIVEDLLESELFGHIKGAFTGAIKDKKGLVEKVGAGTLFLDEIGELSLKAQKKLLFLLEEKRFLTVGDTVEKEFKGRIIAATNRNLREMVEKGEFREDLYFRLRVFSYTFAPLRSSPDELKYYLQYFFNHYKKLLDKEFLGISPECMRALMDYSWFGNIREVKNCMEYMVTLAKEKKLELEHLPEWLTQYSSFMAGMAGSKKDRGEWENRGIRPEYLPLDYEQALEVFEASYLSYILKKFHGRVNFTSEMIKLSKSTLIAKTKKYGINTMLLRAKKHLERHDEQRTLLELSKKR